MIQQYHILNGDALKAQFPKSILGNHIVARECLVDGPIESDTLDDLYKSRVRFLNNYYGGCTFDEYKTKVISEFEKVQSIPNNVDINLWFEDDLFCQVNLWFVIHLLSLSNRRHSVFLVRPKVHTQYGFGGLSESELINIFNNRMPLESIDQLSNLWSLYQNGNNKLLLKHVENLGTNYTFMIPAIRAHIDRIPSNDFLGKPKEALLKISKTLNTNSFPKIFKAFCKQESIYGYGDMQVKRLLDELNDKI